jgi:hypothetical protein
VVADTATGDFWVPGVASFRRLVPRSVVMDEAAIDAWADARLHESAEGAFFGAGNDHAYVARRHCSQRLVSPGPRFRNG